ncbi:MAG: hypothetical protein KJI69_00535 [Patescibacteria group bacterium]|nr:hypothetical protein [Patescibacteria group bacterium]
MDGRQRVILKELLEKYFVGGNASSDNENSIALSKKLDVIRDFVKENF